MLFKVIVRELEVQAADEDLGLGVFENDLFIFVCATVFLITFLARCGTI